MKLRSLILVLFVCIALFFSAMPGHAAYLEKIAVKVIQPNGTELSLFLTGDEYYQRLHDANDYTILRNADGYFVYALLENDVLIPGTLIVGQGDPRSLGIKPGLNITPEKWKQLRADFWKDSPASKMASQSLTTGTVNNVVIFIRFSDQTAFPANRPYYDSIFNNTTAGANSMYNYFKEASYNNMTIPTTFYPVATGTLILSYQDIHDRDYYSPWDTLSNPTGYKPSQRTDREHTLLRAAVSAIASQVPVGLNLDYNNDGDIDNICFIIRGGTTAWSSILWPHRWSLYTSPAVSINGKDAYDYNVQLEDFLPGSGVGVLAHEMFHTFGAPDLYHYTGNGISPCGPWDIMDNNLNPPQHMSAFMKYKYGGWISSIPTITAAGTYTLNPLTSSTNNAYKIPTGASSTEYFVVEYRKKTGTFENSLPGSGLVVYRINTIAGNGNADGPPDEIYTYRPGGSLSTNGTTSQGFFNSTVGRTAFNDTTNPACFLSDDSNAHINIYNIGLAGNTISFQYGIAPIANFSANILSTCPFQTITLSDNSGGIITSRTWTFTPNTVIFVNGTNASSQYPQVQFAAPGNYTVSLAITTTTGSNTKTKNNYIHISSPVITPFTDDFESGTFATKAWTLGNEDQQTTWEYELNATGNGSSTKCLWMNFYDYNNPGSVDALISPGISLPGSGTAKLKFKVAYRPYSNDYPDTLKVAIYNNCGLTLASIPYAKSDSVLATGPDEVNFYTPIVASDWRTDSIDLSAYMGQTIVIKFLAINGYGNNLYLDDISMTTQGGVLANFSANTTNICQNESVNFTDLSTGTPTSWAWTFGDGQTSTQQNPSHQYLTSGPKTISLTVFKTGSSNTLIKTAYIEVNPILPVSVSISASPNGPVCAGTLITYSATPVNGGTNPSYQWRVNNINVGTNNPVFSYNPINGDQVKCLLTSSNTCITGSPATSNTITMAINPIVIASVTIGTPSTSLCQGTPAVFTANPVNGGTTPFYQWKVNNINAGINSPTFNYSPSHADQVKCILTSNASCNTGSPASSNTVAMTVLPYPLVNLGNDTTIPLSDNLILNAGSGYSSYAWNTGETTQYKTVSTSGTFSVTVTNAASCASSDVINVIHGYSTIYGTIYYLNALTSPLDSVTVALKSGNTTLQTYTTGHTGNFQFTGIIPGNYSLEASTQKYWGGVNSADALSILKHFTLTAPLIGLKLKAADVNLNSAINSLDGLLISRRFVGVITSFAAGDWVFEKPSITFTGNNNVMQNIPALCTGDVNGSFVPFAKLSNNLNLMLQGNTTLQTKGKVLIPLITTKPLELGAISMIISFPSDDYELLDVKIPTDKGHLEFASGNGEIRISWFGLDPIKLSDNEAVVNLYFRSLKDEFAPLLLNTLAGTELVDGDALVIPPQSFNYPFFQQESQDGSLRAEVYPSPGDGRFTIELLTPTNDRVDVSIFTASGEVIFDEVNIPVNGIQNRIFNISNKAPGLYYVLIKDKHSAVSRKLIIQ